MRLSDLMSGVTLLISYLKIAITADVAPSARSHLIRKHDCVKLVATEPRPITAENVSVELFDWLCCCKKRK